MTSEMRIELVLVGARAEFTGKLNNLHFVRGHAKVSGSADSVGHVINYYRSYHAFPVGSDELAAAQAAFAPDKEKENGSGNPAQDAKSGAPESVPGSVRPAGEGAAKAPDVPSGGDAPRSPGNTGPSAAGSGHADAGLSGQQANGSAQPGSESSTVNQALVAAVLKLDPDNADHWTEGGAPKVSAVALAYGNEALTRREIEEAAPGWNREAAQAHALA